MSVRFILNKNVDFKNCIFVSGFHGIGLTGFIAVKHLVESLNAERIGFVESDKLPPFVAMSDNGVSTPFELYMYSKLVFLVVEISPSKEEQYAFSRAVVDWVVQNGFSRAILIGGLDNRFKKEDDGDSKFICTSAFKRLFSVDERLLMDKGLYVFGLLASFLARFEMMNFPAIAVLPFAEASRPDPNASANAVKYINSVCNLDVSVSKLIEDAELIESEVKKLMHQWSEKTKSDKEKSLYM